MKAYYFKLQYNQTIKFYWSKLKQSNLFNDCIELYDQFGNVSYKTKKLVLQCIMQGQVAVSTFKNEKYDYILYLLPKSQWDIEQLEAKMKDHCNDQIFQTR